MRTVFVVIFGTIDAICFTFLALRLRNQLRRESATDAVPGSNTKKARTLLRLSTVGAVLAWVIVLIEAL